MLFLGNNNTHSNYMRRLEMSTNKNVLKLPQKRETGYKEDTE